MEIHRVVVNRIGRAASSADKVQILWQAWHAYVCGKRNMDLNVINFEVLMKTRRKSSILELQSMKIGRGLVRNTCFFASTCLVSRRWFSCGIAVSMGEARKLSHWNVSV